VVAVVLVPVGLGWIGVYLVLGIVRWVRRGFVPSAKV
jgi:hypothetical protein